jgi:cathepsin H
MAYPYEGKDHKCRYTGKDIGVKVPRGAHNITAYDETELTLAVAFTGPVSIAYQVLDDFSDYSGGVYSNKKCQHGPDTVNHAVLAVGYGVNSKGIEYWIMKNSWGADWGLDGYFWIERNKNMCGLAVCNSYPILDKVTAWKIADKL